MLFCVRSSCFATQFSGWNDKRTFLGAKRPSSEYGCENTGEYPKRHTPPSRTGHVQNLSSRGTSEQTLGTTVVLQIFGKLPVCCHDTERCDSLSTNRLTKGLISYIHGTWLKLFCTQSRDQIQHFVQLSDCEVCGPLDANTGCNMMQLDQGCWFEP